MDQELRQKLDAAHEARINGDYAAAEALYGEVLDQLADPIEEAEARYGLGCALLFSGKFDEGLAELASAHGKNPGDPKIT
ncbi:MAG: tetratricopeptide repeat protein, partial [Armatimonadota bacterium]